MEIDNTSKIIDIGDSVVESRINIKTQQCSLLTPISIKIGDRGCYVAVVEDHSKNVEVAKRLPPTKIN